MPGLLTGVPSFSLWLIAKQMCPCDSSPVKALNPELCVDFLGQSSLVRGVLCQGRSTQCLKRGGRKEAGRRLCRASQDPVDAYFSCCYFPVSSTATNLSLLSLVSPSSKSPLTSERKERSSAPFYPAGHHPTLRTRSIPALAQVTTSRFWRWAPSSD